MADALIRLGNAVADIEKQAQEIEQYKGILQKVSEIGNEAKKVNEHTSTLIDKQDELIGKNLKLIEDLKQNFEQQNKHFKNFEQITKNQISSFSHEFIEKSSILRDESLSAHIDLRHDIERVYKYQKKNEDLIQSVSETLNENFSNSSKEIEKIALGQNEKIKANKNLSILIVIILIFLCCLELITNFN